MSQAETIDEIEKRVDERELYWATRLAAEDERVLIAEVRRLRSMCDFWKRSSAQKSEMFHNVWVDREAERTRADDATARALAAEEESAAARRALRDLTAKFDAAIEQGTTYDGKAPPTLLFVAPMRKWFDEARAVLSENPKEGE